MPKIALNGTTIYYEDTGGGGPVLLFSHGLLFSAEMFRAQVEYCRDRYRCVAYDHRGQGRSAAAATRSIGMDLLFEDVVALVETLELAPVHFVGLSMGGFVGLRLAARRPELVQSLTLIATSAEAEAKDRARRYKAMSTLVRFLGSRPVVEQVLPILFGRTFLTDPRRAAERAAWRNTLIATRRDIWRAVNGVCDRPAVAEECAGIHVPTLVIAGDEDVAIGPGPAARLEEAVAGAKLLRIPAAGHSATIEAPAAVNAALEGFLEQVRRVAPRRAAHGTAPPGGTATGR